MYSENCPWIIKNDRKILAATERVQHGKVYDTLFIYTGLIKGGGNITVLVDDTINSFLRIDPELQSNSVLSLTFKTTWSVQS